MVSICPVPWWRAEPLNAGIDTGAPINASACDRGRLTLGRPAHGRRHMPADKPSEGGLVGGIANRPTLRERQRNRARAAMTRVPAGSRPLLQVLVASRISTSF